MECYLYIVFATVALSDSVVLVAFFIFELACLSVSCNKAEVVPIILVHRDANKFYLLEVQLVPPQPQSAWKKIVLHL